MTDKIRREKIIFCVSRQKEQVSSIRLLDLLTAILKKMKPVKYFLPSKIDFQTKQANTNYYHIQRVISEKEKTIFRYLK